MTHSALTMAILVGDTEPNDTLATAIEVTQAETHPDVLVVDWSGTITKSSIGGFRDEQDNISFSLQQDDVVLLSKRVFYSDELVNRLAETELVGPLPNASVFLGGGTSGTIRKIEETGTWYLQASIQATDGVFGYGIGFVIARGNVDIVHSGNLPSPVRRQNTMIANEFILKPQFGVVGADTDKNPIANLMGIYLEAGEVLGLALDTSAGLLSPLVTIKSPDGTLLDSGTNSLANVTAPVSGFYQVEVTADDATSDLAIQGGQGPRGYYYATGTISSPQSNIVGEVEPNNLVSEANVLNLSPIQGGSGNVLTVSAIGNIEGQFTGDFDRSIDWYSIELQAGDRLDFETTKFSGIDIKVQMLDENQISIRLTDTSTNVNTYAVPVSGTYYLSAELTNNSFGNSSHYGFSVLVTRDAWIEQAGRNTILPRENLVGGGLFDYRLKPITGIIEADPTTLDPLAHSLRIYLEAGEMLTGLSVNVGQGTLKPRLKLADPDGVEVATGLNTLTDYTAPVTGLYQLTLDSQDTIVGSGNEGGQGFNAIYELTGLIKATRSNLVADAEPNNLTSQATPLNLEAINNGTLFSGSAIGQIQGQFTGDQDRTSDWYSLDLQAGDRIDIVASRLDGNTGVKVSLLNDAQISFVQTDTSTNINTFAIPVTGKYFLSAEIQNASAGFFTHYGFNVLVSRDAWLEQAGRNTIVPRETLAGGSSQDFRLKPVAGIIEASATLLDPLPHAHQFYLEQGETLNLAINSNLGTLMPKLTLSDPAATEVASGTNAIVDYIASTTGLFKIEVSSQDITPGSGDEGGQGYRATYELSGTIVAVRTALVAEVEPNDLLTEATPTLLISDGNGTRTGQVYGQIEGQFSGNANRSTDYFVLDLMTGESVSFVSSRLGGNVGINANLLSSTGATAALGSPTQGGIHYLHVTLASGSSGFFAAYQVEISVLGPDTDGDGMFDVIDADDDNDDVLDENDAFPLDSSESVDTDGDGIGNNADTDDDGDNVPDVDDAFPLDNTRSVAETNTAPMIAIEGAATFTLNVGEAFSDPGALAVDDQDGDLTGSVMTMSDVDITVPGRYTVEYLVTDSGSLTSKVTRSVLVVEPLSSGAVRILAGQVIELPVIGTGLIAPNGVALIVPATATAASINVTAVTPGASGFMTVWPCGVPQPLASNLNYVAGDVVPNGVLAPIGSNGKVCFFSQADTDVVVDVAGWFEGDAFVGATPLRLVDTRATSRVTPATPLVLKVADIAANTAAGAATIIPTNVGAVALNVTVVSPDAAGFVTVYPCDVARPLASNVNYTAGQIVPNGVIAPVSANGEVCIYSLAPTDVVVDLAGWFPGEAFTAATPQRLVDTRDGTGGQLGKLDPAGQLSVAVQGVSLSVGGNSAQVPLTATAAALNVTIVNPDSSGFATVWPCSAARPLASNLNFVAGQVMANNVIAPIGDQGNVCFYTNVPSDIIVDVAGYFSGQAGNQFVGSTPKRYIDTRSSLGPAPQ